MRSTAINKTRGYELSEWDQHPVDYDRGALILDIADRKTSRLIWRGSAHAKLHVTETSTKEKEEQYSQEIQDISEEPSEINPKGELQEILQAISSTSPHYKVTFEGGPDHNKTFETNVTWERRKLGTGTGTSKKEAEISAAKDALEKRRWEKKTSGKKPRK